MSSIERRSSSFFDQSPRIELQHKRTKQERSSSSSSSSKSTPPSPIESAILSVTPPLHDSSPQDLRTDKAKKKFRISLSLGKEELRDNPTAQAIQGISESFPSSSNRLVSTNPIPSQTLKQPPSIQRTFSVEQFQVPQKKGLNFHFIKYFRPTKQTQTRPTTSQNREVWKQALLKNLEVFAKERWAQLGETDATSIVLKFFQEQTLEMTREMKAECVSFMEKMLSLEEAIYHTDMLVKSFPIAFDLAHPIAEISKEAIVDSFRFYCVAGSRHKSSDFSINGASLNCPTFSKESAWEMKKLFMQWLIENLNRAMEVDDRALIASLQAELVCEGAPFQDRINALAATLQKLFKENGRVVKRILRKLHDDQDLKKFHKWAEKNLEELISKGITERQIASHFLQNDWKNTCHQQVPSFRLLQALSFSAYSHATRLIQEHLAPKLFHLDPTRLRIKTFPQDRVHYTIEIDPTSKSFTVTHHKLYRFVTGDTENYISYGSVDVHWSLRGRFNSTQFSCKIWCDTLQFDEDQPFEICFQIAENLGVIPRKDEANR
jgi:hypothetical protein